MKTMPDMLSVLSTAASEDVAHLLGGVDLALEGDPKLIRRWFWCKADSYCGLPLWVGRVYSIWRLCFVGALLASGDIKFFAGCFHFSPPPYKVSSPCTALDGGTWEAGCAFKGGSDCIEEEIVVSGEPWFAPLPPPLVPTSMA